MSTVYSSSIRHLGTSFPKSRALIMRSKLKHFIRGLSELVAMAFIIWSAEESNGLILHVVMGNKERISGRILEVPGILLKKCCSPFYEKLTKVKAQNVKSKKTKKAKARISEFQKN
jgi:hypothetical protein